MTANGKPDPTDGDRALAEELRLAIGSLVRTTRGQADQLPRAHAETLAQLDADDGKTIAELAARRGVRHQAMSRTVSELEDQHLIDRTPSSTDGRAFVIRLTAAGRAALQQDREARRDTLARAIATLPAQDRKTLEAVPSLLRKLSRSEERQQAEPTI